MARLGLLGIFYNVCQCVSPKYIDPAIGPIEHGGVCLEYNCDDAWRSGNLHPVEYSDLIPEINVIKRDESEITKAIMALRRRMENYVNNSGNATFS